MSKFSNYLKNLLDKNNEPISSVARSINAERTSIHKALSDERILPYRVVHALANYFHLSLEERREFFRLYDMLIQGENAWYNREAVGELFNHLSAQNFRPVILDTNQQKPVSLPALSDDLIEGEYAVMNTIYAILCQEADQNPDAVFHLFLPLSIDLSSFLMHLWLNGADFKVEQFFCFPTTAHHNSSQNIQTLHQIIPLCLIARDAYHPYYFYEHLRYLSTNPFNYYIITPDYLILLSEDRSSAYVHHSKSIIRLFYSHFQELKNSCEPLTSLYMEPSEVIENYNTVTNPDGFFHLMIQPCFARYYTPELIAKYLIRDDSSGRPLLDAAVKRFAMIQQIDKNFYTVFSEKGLQSFAENGILAEMPPEYVRPVEVSDRRLLLSRLRDDIIAGNIIGLITRPSYLRFPDYLYLYMEPDGNAYFDTTIHFIRGAYYCDIHISEKNIRQAFRDFFRSLPGSQMVYSQEDTIRILDENIQKCGRT